MTSLSLPYGAHFVDDDDIAAVVEALRSDRLTTGPVIDAFEHKLAETVGAFYAVACSSGTSALHLASLALGLGPDDAVIVPSLTFLATANAPHATGAEIIFADVDPHTGLMTPETFSAALESASERTVRAVFPVHLNGQCVAMGEIATIAEANGISIVEDACHAIGARYPSSNSPVGSGAYSAAAAFSFHPVKTIAMGEGGAVTTNDSALAAAMRRFRNHGMVSAPDDFENPDAAFDSNAALNPWYYEMPIPGFNYRASDIHCALALSQLAKLQRFVTQRAALVSIYDNALAPFAPLVKPLRRVAGGCAAWHLYVVQIDFAAAGVSRGEVMRRLAGQGIGTQVHYIPVHRQPYYARRYGALDLPGADAYSDHILSLPLFVGLASEDVARVVRALAQALRP